MAAAALDVFVGSAQNPEHRQGLAHFLEHMLFLGTEKYPEPGEYQAFIKANGGQHNAYTSFEHTQYFFTVTPDALPEALDRFSQFFISPLFDADYVERERHAVDAEYQSGLRDDSRRSLEVLKQQLNQQHPFSRFAVGNEKTLAGDGKQALLDDLQAFYKRYYSASIMSLSVVADKPLDELEQWVREDFSAIADFKVEKLAIEKPMFEKGKLPLWLEIKPEKNQRTMLLAFELPDQMQAYPDKSLDAIGHVLGHEGEGSLLSYLKRENLAESLGAGQLLAYRGATVFSLSIGLTQKGLTQQEQVLAAVFATLDKLRQQGVGQASFNELKRSADLQFMYQKQMSAEKTAMRLANNLQYFPVQDVWRAPYRYDKYRPESIDKLLSELTLSNAYIATLADFEGESDKQTPFYHVDYRKREVNKQAILNKDIPSIVLPGKNLWLPEQLSLVSAGASQTVPQLLEDKKGYQLWYLPLSGFNEPRLNIYTSVESKNLQFTAKNQITRALYAALLNDSLNEFLYPVSLAGMNVDIYPNAKGLTIKTSGFSEKQSELFVQLMQQIPTLAFTEANFNRVRLQLLKSLENDLKAMPYHRLLALLQQQLRFDQQSIAAQIAVLKTLSLEDINRFSSDFWQAVNIRTLFNGNISKAQAKAAMGQVLPKMPIAAFDKKAIEVKRLPEGKQQLRMALEHDDSAYVLYMQGADKTLKSQALWMLAAKVLEPQFFHQLRTEQQLGYIVFAGYFSSIRVPGVVFTVQSPRADVKAVHDSVQAFMADQLPRLSLLGERQLNQYKQGLIKNLQRKPRSLQEQSDRLWQLLALSENNFDWREQLVATLQKIDAKTWQQFVQSLSGDCRCLLLTSPPEGQLPEFTDWQGRGVNDKQRFTFP